MSLAERVRENIAHTPFEVQNNPPITITVSIGVSSITEEMTNIDDMLRSADAALYHAKHDGRNRVMKCQ
jgi:diguanylate cyclase (GGDEF)-like protein